MFNCPSGAELSLTEQLGEDSLGAACRVHKDRAMMCLTLDDIPLSEF